MAPTKAADKSIAKELADVVRQTYNGPDSALLSVNYVRQVVEEKLKLDDGFLKEGNWKSKSKQIILDTLVGCTRRIIWGRARDNCLQCFLRTRLKMPTQNLLKKSRRLPSKKPNPRPRMAAAARRSAQQRLRLHRMRSPR